MNKSHGSVYTRGALHKSVSEETLALEITMCGHEMTATGPRSSRGKVHTKKQGLMFSLMNQNDRLIKQYDKTRILNSK